MLCDKCRVDKCHGDKCCVIGHGNKCCVMGQREKCCVMDQVEECCVMGQEDKCCVMDQENFVSAREDSGPKYKIILISVSVFMHIINNVFLNQFVNILNNSA